MNILFLNDIPFKPALGGIERVTDLLAKALIKKGYVIYYLCGYTDNKESFDYDFPVPMYTLPCTGLFEESKNIKYYKNFIEENNIDIVINQRGLDLRFERILDIKGVKKISVLHSTPYAPYRILTKVFYKSNNFKGYIINIAKFFFYPLILLRNRKRAYSILSKHYNYLSNNSDAIILLSSQYKEEFLAFDIKEVIPILGIPNPNTYNSQNIEIGEKEKIILYVGRFEATDKNPMRLLKIWQLLHKKHTDWKLVLVGNGSELKKMQLYIYKNKLLNVQFAGNQKNVLDYYRTASFICLTSNFEGWPMSLTEGMCCKCIPFAFNSFAAISDIIQDGVNGHIIKSFELKEYANKLSILMQNKTKREKMALEAQKKISNFDINKIICKWERIFNLISDRKSDSFSL